MAVFAFACLGLVSLVLFAALRSLSLALGEAHRKLMARDLQELASAEATQRWAEGFQHEAQQKAPAPPEAASFDPAAAWYGDGWRFPS